MPPLRQQTLTGKPAPSASTVTRLDTDAVLSIRSMFVQLIALRKKNHEYRKYKLKDSLVRIWIYETTPVSAITYVMETTKPKTPGQVQDPTGVGNDDFDNGLKDSKFGYPVLALYKLKTPLTMHEMKTKVGISPPQRYVYATTSLVEAYPLGEMEKVF